MRTEARAIDLGTYRYDADGGNGEAPDARPWRPRPGSVRAGGLGLAAVLSLSLAGAAAPSPPPLERLWSVTLESEQRSLFSLSAVDEERIYVGVADRSGSRSEPAGMLAAYRLSDGQIEWQRPLETWNPPGVRLAGGSVLVTTSGPRSDETTTAYDAVTGQQRWTHPAYIYHVLEDWVVLRRMQFGPGAPAERRTELVPVDPDTGEGASVIRARPDSLGRLIHGGTPDGASYLYGLDRDGTLTRYDPATGAARAVETPHAEREENVTQNWVSTVDGVLLLGSRGGDAPARISGYDPETLDHWWTVDGSHAHGCGAHICVDVEPAAGQGRSSVVAVDPETGAVSWTPTCPGVAADDCQATSVRQMEPTERIWVEEFPRGRTAGGPPQVRAWVADAADGRPLTGVTHWHLAGQPNDSHLLLVRDDGVVGREDGPDPPRNRFWWARSDADLIDTRVLGTTEAQHCRPVPPYLLCQHSQESLTVWRIRR